MKIKFRSQIRNKVVNMIIETGEFTEDENDILNQVGEPIIIMDKMYGANPIKFEKKVRSGFRISVKFDGNLSESMDDVMDLIQQFKLDLAGSIEEEMNQAALSYSELLNKLEDEGDEIVIDTKIPGF